MDGTADERTLELLVRTSADLSERPPEGMESYLFPGEEVTLKESSGALVLYLLSSGRHLMQFEGRLAAPSKTGMGLSAMEVSAYMVHCIERSMMTHNIANALRSAIQKQSFVCRAATTGGIGNKGRSGRNGGEKVSKRGSLAMELLELMAPGVRLGSLFQAALISGKKERLRGLASDIGAVLNRGEGGDPTKAKVPALKRNVETLIEAMKGERGMTKEVSGEAVRGIIEDLEKVLKDLKGVAGPTNGRYEELASRVSALLFDVLLCLLIRLEILSSWSDPAISAWEELKVERQRAIKAELAGIFDLLGRMATIEDSALRVTAAYGRNMGRRSSLRALSLVEISKARESFGGPPSEIWRNRVTIKAPEGSLPAKFKAYFHLPMGSWQLLSPPAVREGLVLDLGVFELSPGSRFSIDLEVRPPPSPPRTEKALLYLMPTDSRLEEES